MNGTNPVPTNCPECGQRDFDVTMIAWISHSDGKSNGCLGDTALAGFPDAEAHCTWCGHTWPLEWRLTP